MMVISSGREPELIIGFTQDQERLVDKIRQTQPTETPGNLESALFMAVSFLNPERDDWIYVITDGAGGNYEKARQFHRKRARLIP